jgi:hypothetical protein
MDKLPRCQVVPVAGRQAVFLVDGQERTRWHFSEESPGPYFYPLLGPSGETLTRMGHPGAPDHDHHRSVWFAHYKVLGIDFWSMNMPGQIRQLQWYEYRDGDDECGMAVNLGWFDGHDPQPLFEQELIAFLRPLENHEYTLELQSTFRPQSAELEFQQTNFGFLAVRVAKSISAQYGGGELTGASGERGEPALFGNANAWMDYSGPVAARNSQGASEVCIEGITYFDHPANPHYPAKWHVRRDGWMGASACRDESLITRREAPLVLRYLLHVHSGELDPVRANELAAAWNQTPRYEIVRPQPRHVQWQIQRVAT